MAAWWQAANPDVVVAPGDRFVPGTVRDPRFLDRELVQPGPGRRLRWDRVADVLGAVGDVSPLSLYETTAADVTAIAGPSVHCYSRPDGEMVVESVDPHGWRRFTFHPEAWVLARLVMGLATITPTEPGRLVACALGDPTESVLLTDGTAILLGDLPADPGPVRRAVHLSPEDIHVLLFARVRVPAGV